MLCIENALVWETHALIKVELIEWRQINDCKPYFCVWKVKSAKKRRFRNNNDNEKDK